MLKKVYFDYSATTPILPEVLESMKPFFSEYFGNAGSVHSFGQDAYQAVETAREQIAQFLGCEFNEFIFTGCATESNNIALQGVIKKGDHLITSQIEHPAVMEVAKHLESIGAQVTYIKVDSRGLVDEKDVINAVKENTKLVSIMYVNNEIGTIQPILEIGKHLKEINQSREKKVYFHTDAVQAGAYLSCNVDKLNIDLLSLSAHKIYGPKGVGCLYVRNGTKINPITYGGGHEYGLRPGTENVPSIVGFGAAVQEIQKRNNFLMKIKEFQKNIINNMQDNIFDFEINGDLNKRIPANLNICFKNIESESIIYAMDMEGIAISSASACSSKALKPSYVIKALGKKDNHARTSIRISLGYTTTEEEVEYLNKKLVKVIKEIKK